MDENDLHRWLGRIEEQQDSITPRMLREFAATLSPHGWTDASGGTPPLIHWCLAPPVVPTEQAGADGHPKTGGFLPPVPLPRRMWASSDITFYRAPQLGETVHRRSEISRIEHKRGRSGDLWFVDVRHDWSAAGASLLREIQTLVYRAADTAGSVAPAPTIERAEADAITTVDTSTLRLFRYSSLTFNGHRIHYDLAYARDVEGYAGLVVHGPLQATLLAHGAAALIGRAPRHFRFRGVSSCIAGPPAEMRFKRAADTVTCCVCGADGAMTMEAVFS